MDCLRSKNDRPIWVEKTAVDKVDGLLSLRVRSMSIIYERKQTVNPILDGQVGVSHFGFLDRLLSFADHFRPKMRQVKSSTFQLFGPSNFMLMVHGPWPSILDENRLKGHSWSKKIRNLKNKLDF